MTRRACRKSRRERSPQRLVVAADLWSYPCPKTCWWEEVEVADVAVTKYPVPGPDEGDLGQLRDMLSASSKPLVIFGGGGWSAETCAELQAFCEANDLPAIASFRTQDIFNNDHPNFIGELGYNTNPKLAQRVKDADLILAIGARLGETATMAYSLIKAPRPDQKLIHVYPDHSELGRVFQADLPDRHRSGGLSDKGPPACAGRSSSLGRLAAGGGVRISTYGRFPVTIRGRSICLRPSSNCVTSCRTTPS